MSDNILLEFTNLLKDATKFRLLKDAGIEYLEAYEHIVLEYKDIMLVKYGILCEWEEE